MSRPVSSSSLLSSPLHSMVGFLAGLAIGLGGTAPRVSASEAPETAVSSQPSQPKVIYGADNRRDWYEVSNSDFLRAADSTVALVKSSSISAAGGIATLSGKSLASAAGVCATEPYAQQMTAAFCSGSLIDQDIVITAGHCITSASDCSSTRFVFGYAYRSMGSSAHQVPVGEVYSCAQVIHTQHDNPGTNAGADFAIIRLDRPVAGHAPLNFRKSGQPDVGTPLVVIGHPVGLPSKISDGAKIRSTSPQGYFVANLDTYGGNSGSAVFNSQTMEIEGILVRGDKDFVGSSAGCRVSYQCSDDACRGEDVTRISEVRNLLNAARLKLSAQVIDSSANASNGTGSITIRVTNVGSESAEVLLSLKAKSGSQTLGSTSALAPAVGQSVTAKIAVSGLSPSALVNAGMGVTVQVSFGSYSYTEVQTSLRWKLQDRISAEIDPAVTKVSPLEGKAVLGIRVQNTGSQSTSAPLVIKAAGAELRVPVIAAGSTQTVQVPMTGLDPLALIDGMPVGLALSVQLPSRDASLEGIDLGKLTLKFSGSADGLLLQYFDQLNRGLGVVPLSRNRAEQISATGTRLVEANLQEARRIRREGSKLYIHNPSQTILGKIVGQYQSARPEGRTNYEALATGLWNARRVFFGLIIKSKQRKAYEALCLQLSRDGVI